MYDGEHERLQVGGETGKTGRSQYIKSHNCHGKEFGIYSVGEGIFNWGQQTFQLTYRSSHMCPVLCAQVFIVHIRFSDWKPPKAVQKRRDVIIRGGVWRMK